MTVPQERTSLFPFLRTERTPQLRDDVILTLLLPPETEEWAEEFLAADEIERTDDALTLRHRIGGNCNSLSNAASWLRDVEDAMSEADIDPMVFVLTAATEETCAICGRGITRHNPECPDA